MGILLICQNTTTQVYGAWIDIYYVLCSKTYSTSGNLLQSPLVRDKSLGAPTFVRLVCWSTCVRCMFCLFLHFLGESPDWIQTCYKRDLKLSILFHRFVICLFHLCEVYWDLLRFYLLRTFIQITVQMCLFDFVIFQKDPFTRTDVFMVMGDLDFGVQWRPFIARFIIANIL